MTTRSLTSKIFKTKKMANKKASRVYSRKRRRRKEALKANIAATTAKKTRGSPSWYFFQESQTTMSTRRTRARLSAKK